MPLCLIVGCSRKSGRDKGIRMYRVPAVVTNQGPEVEELSIKRRRLWISAISHDDVSEKILNSDRVCDQHFHSGTAAPLWDCYNIDWVRSYSQFRPCQFRPKRLERRGPRKGENDRWNCKNRNVC